MSLKKVADLFPPLIAGLIFLLLENSNNFDQRECGSLLTSPILSLAGEGERAFSFSSWNNAFVDEYYAFEFDSFSAFAHHKAR